MHTCPTPLQACSELSPENPESPSPADIRSHPGSVRSGS